MDNSMHVDSLDANLSSRSVSEAGDVENLSATSSKGRFSPQTCNVSEQSRSEAASELPDDEPASKLVIYSDACSSTQTDTHTMSHTRQCEDNSLNAPEVTCTEFDEVRPGGSVVGLCSEVDSDPSNGTNVLPGVHELVKDSEDSFKNQKVVNLSNNCLTSTPDTDANCELNHLDSRAISAVDNQEVNIKRNDLVNNRIDQRPLKVHPQSTTSLQHSSSSPQPGSPSQYSQSLIDSGRNHVQHCSSFTGSHSLSNGLPVADTDIAGESHYLPEASIEDSGSHNQNICLSYKEALDEASNCEQPLLVGDKYEHSTACRNEQSLDSVPDSVYAHPGLVCSIKDDYNEENDSEESSYRQHISSSTEEMDTGVLDEDDVADVTVNSSVYQSYEDGIGPQYEAGAAAVGLMDMPLVAQYDTTGSEANHADGVSNMAVLCSSQAVGDDTSSTALVPLQNTATDAATSSTEAATTSISCSSPSLSTHQPLGSASDQERMFAHGEQAFIAARQAASVPFVPAGCQLPYHPGMNPSMYAGAAMVQGLARPTMMTSSSVHIAQHPGGATIMQHQSMSTGLTGAMSQATVMQQQAMANGVQSTSLLQRTLTNGGQTMVVQQRTMTTGLDGMTQQTVVQQQMAAPGMSPAAMFHANAMRQRNMATQQANMMQQRSIRLVQAGVMGNAMLHAQALRGAGLMPGGQMAPTTLIQHGMLRGVSQGTMMQQLVRQRYLGGPVMPGRGIQLMAGRPIRVKMTYPRESMPMDT